MQSTLRQVLLCTVTAALLLLLPTPAVVAQSTSQTTIAVAGSIAQDREGVYGVNSLNAPSAMCSSYSPNSADSTIMIGAANYMFTLNRYSTMLNFFFGNASSAGTAVDWTTATSAPFGTTRFTSPIYGCVTTPQTASNSTIFYVSNDRYIYTANPNTQLLSATSVVIDTVNEALFDITLYNNMLYALTTSLGVYACTYATTIACTKLNIQGDAAFTSMANPARPFMGLAVSAAGIFIAPGSSLYWFSLAGVQIAKTATGVNFIDVSYTQRVNLASGGTTSLVAASTTNLYTIVASGTTLTATALTTTSYTNAVRRIFPLTTDSIFVASSVANRVYWATYMNTTVATTMSRTPYPVSFVDQTTVMPLLLSYMDYEVVQIAGTVPYPGAAIRTSSVAVDDTLWDTNFDVDVSSLYYTPALGSKLQAGPTSGGYDRSLRALTSYYNRTNEMISGDYNLLPYCNITKMTNIRHSLASDVRTLLMYPFIYTSPAKHITVNGQPNLTLIKLLMPYPFGTYLVDSTFTTNTTTPTLLATYDAATMMVVYTRMNYQPSHIFDALFAVARYPKFATLSAVQQQELRWAVYADVLAQLAKCEAAAGGTGEGLGSSSISNSDMLSDCKPRVGIDNMTRYDFPGVSPTPFNFTIFIPEGLYTNFNISNCLNGTDWTNVDKYNNTLTKSGAKCGTGCIVGVAVASAVVAAILVVVIVILTSKRRRLATVIVPMSGAEPKFTSTADVDSSYGSANPLA